MNGLDHSFAEPRWRRLWNWARARWGTLVRTPDHELEVLPYEPEWHRLWRLCRFRRRLIAYVAGGIALFVLLMTTLVMTPAYQAQAIIRPNTQEGSGLSAIAGTLLGGSATSGGSISSLLGGGGLTGTPGAGHDPEELIAILQSFAFTDSLLAET